MQLKIAFHILGFELQILRVYIGLIHK
jgi:hypothetical protein